MKKKIVFGLLLSMFFAGSLFAAERLKPEYIEEGRTRGTVFPASYELQFLKGYGRWDPAREDIIKAERLVDKFLNTYSSGKEYYSISVFKILGDRTSYKAQYFGLVGKNGDKVIWINYYYSPKRIKEADSAVHIVMDGGYRFFNIKVNLTTGKCEDLQINGEA